MSRFVSSPLCPRQSMRSCQDLCTPVPIFQHGRAKDGLGAVTCAYLDITWGTSCYHVVGRYTCTRCQLLAHEPSRQCLQIRGSRHCTSPSPPLQIAHSSDY